MGGPSPPTLGSRVFGSQLWPGDLNLLVVAWRASHLTSLNLPPGFQREDDKRVIVGLNQSEARPTVTGPEEICPIQTHAAPCSITKVGCKARASDNLYEEARLWFRRVSGICTYKPEAALNDRWGDAFQLSCSL